MKKECIDSLFSRSFSTDLPGKAGAQLELAHEIIQRMDPLWSLHDRIIFSLMKGIDADSVPVRTKSIRTLSELLNNQSVEKNVRDKILFSISQRFADASPTVREVCVDAVSKYALGQDDIGVLVDYCTKISARIMVWSILKTLFLMQSFLCRTLKFQ